jgi:hypothetical protein
VTFGTQPGHRGFRGRPVDGDLDHHLVGLRLRVGADPAVGHRPADRVRQAGDLAAVIADQHRSPGRGDLTDDVGDQRPGDGVEAFPRFVEHQQPGRDQQGLGQADLLRGALGQVGQPGVAVLGEAEPLDPVLDRGAAPQSAQGRHPGQILRGGEGLIGREALGDPADDRRPVPHGAPDRAQHPGGELEQCRLAGTVAAEHHHGGAGLDGGVHGPQGPLRAACVAEPDLVESHAGQLGTRKPPG